MAGWIISLIVFASLLHIAGKQQKKGKNVRLIRKILACIICFHLNGILTALVYQLAIDTFNIYTDGLLGINTKGVITAGIIWMLIATIMLLLISYGKELFTDLYRAIRIYQIIAIILPIILVLMFNVVIRLK